MAIQIIAPLQGGLPPRIIPRKGKSGLRDTERGDLAVTIAVIAAVLLVLIPLVTYAASTNLLPLTRGNQDYQAALAAAESGIANFVNEVNTNTASPPSTLSTSNWVQVTGAPAEYYYYSASFNGRNNTYNIISTGISLRGKQTYTRTVQETITPASFTDYELYYNSAQLSNTMASLTGCNPNTQPCVWTLNNLPPGQSTPGTFYTAGNYYLNQGGSFSGAPSGVRLETGGQNTGSAAWQQFCKDSGYWKFTGSGSAGSCGSGSSPIGPTSNPISLVPQVTWPTTLSLQSNATAGGCYYEGPTEITMDTAAGAGYPSFYVYSPYTPDTVPNYATCGGSSMANPGGTKVTITSASAFNGTVYVDNYPPNGTIGTSCTLGTVPAYLYSYPTYTSASNETCAGTLLVNGTTGGQITLGAAADVIVDGNLMYADCSSPNLGNDVIGLVAGQDLGVAVNAWDSITNPGPLPYAPNNTCTNVTGQVATTTGVIMGSLFALNGSLIPIDSSTCSNAGFSNLVLYGNIAAGYAGLNGFPSNSYTCVKAKFNNALTYDSRLANLIPPYFPFPVASFSAAATWKEISNPAGLPPLP